MYIYDMFGLLLAKFDENDIRSVARAEAWLKDHNKVIYKCETTILGIWVIIVREDH